MSNKKMTPKDTAPPAAPPRSPGRSTGTGQGSDSAMDAMLRKRREAENSGMDELPEPTKAKGSDPQ